LELEIIGTAGVWHCEADPAQLEAALLNLAVNAKDAMPSGGKLTIESSNAFLDENYCSLLGDVAPGQYVQIAVTDSGAGMTPETMDRAFEPFFTTKQVGKGTGLGLSQVHGFVKQSGGHVKIYSELGQGTTVKIYLPRCSSVSQSEPSTVKREETSAKPGEAILVVEDDDDVRAHVLETLEGAGYRVVVAARGDQALGLLAEEGPIDLLLTDVVLPGMTGRQIAEEAARLRPGLKVLYMTGYSRNAIVHQGRLDHGVELLQKPFSQAELCKRLRSVLDTSA
jgi:CheY-like chemotaxis protein